MSLRDIWQTTVTNLRGFFRSLVPGQTIAPPSLPTRSSSTKESLSSSISSPDASSAAAALTPRTEREQRSRAGWTADGGFTGPGSRPRRSLVKPDRHVRRPFVAGNPLVRRRHVPVRQDASVDGNIPVVDLSAPAGRIEPEGSSDRPGSDAVADAGFDAGFDGESTVNESQDDDGGNSGSEDDVVYVAKEGSRLALTTVLESLLFVAEEAVEPAQFAKMLDLSQEEIVQGLHRLADGYVEAARGIRVQVHNGKYQLVTAPAAAPFIEDFLNLEMSSRLSGPALETLAVVAYRQPATRAHVEAIRGVDCAGVLRTLVQRGLVEEVGRLDAVGRPILYGVTDLFMQHFGLLDLNELPPLEEKEADLLYATEALGEHHDSVVARHTQATGRAPSDNQDGDTANGDGAEVDAIDGSAEGGSVEND